MNENDFQSDVAPFFEIVPSTDDPPVPLLALNVAKLPDSDPGVEGALYSDSGVLTVSAG